MTPSPKSRSPDAPGKDGRSPTAARDCPAGDAPAWLQRNRELTLGRLTASVAHDFNNLLVAVLGNASLLGTEIEDRASAELIAGIVAAAERAAGLNRQLLEYARHGAYRPALLDLEQVAARAFELGRRAGPRRLSAEFRPPAQAGWITADPTWVCQIVLNILLAAGEAAPEGGRLEATAVRAAGPAGSALAQRPCEWLQFELSPRGKTRLGVVAVQEPPADSAAGWGDVGLASARALLRGLGGELEVTTPKSGSVSIRACFGAAEEQSTHRPRRS